MAIARSIETRLCLNNDLVAVLAGPSRKACLLQACLIADPSPSAIVSTYLPNWYNS